MGGHALLCWAAGEEGRQETLESPGPGGHSQPGAAAAFKPTLGNTAAPSSALPEAGTVALILLTSFLGAPPPWFGASPSPRAGTPPCGPAWLPLPYPAAGPEAPVPGGVPPLEMNGLSDGFQKRQPSHKGRWERENPSSSPFSHIMADNRAIQWQVSPLSRLLGMAGPALCFSAVLASGRELRRSHPTVVDGLSSSLANVPVTRKCH